MRLGRGSDRRPRRRRFGRRLADESANSRTNPALANVAANLAAKAHTTESTPRGSYELGLAVRRAIVEHNLRDRALIDIARRLSDPRPDARLGVRPALQQLGALAQLWSPDPQATPAPSSATVAEPSTGTAKSPPRSRRFTRTGLASLSSGRSRARTLVALSVGGLATIALVGVATSHQSPAPMTDTDAMAQPRSGSASMTPITAADRLAQSTRDSPAGKSGEFLSVNTASVAGSLSE